MHKYIIPAPFAQSLYGTTASDTYKSILNISAANPVMAEKFPSNLLLTNSIITEAIDVEIIPDSIDEVSPYTDSLALFASKLQNKIKSIWHDSEQILVLGGDHSVSVGTGAGLSLCVDMSEVGLIYIDAHGDCNTPETSVSKCITGYPVAVNHGLGSTKLTHLFKQNFLKKTSYIGLRDIDELEANNLKMIGAKVYSIFDVEEFGMSAVVQKTLEDMKDCKYIWLSIDIDCLDSVYFSQGETDVPVSGGLTPRELLFIIHKIQQSGKLKVTEITQLNNVHKQTPLVSLVSRLSELALGLGGFRYKI